MKSFTNLILIFALSLFGSRVLGQGSQTTENTTQTPTADASISEAAAKAMAAQKAAAMRNMMAGTALMAMGMAGCQGTQTWGCPLLPMAAMAFMQAGHDNNMAGLSGNTYDSSINDPSDVGDVGQNGPGSETPTGGGGATGFTDNINKNLEELASKGVVVDPNKGTVTTTDGETFPTSAFSSPGAMAAAGMSDSAVKAAENALSKLNADEGMHASVGAMGIDGGGGGYSGSSGGASEYQGSSLADYFSNLNKGKGKDKDRLIAGKSLTYGNDPIGVKVDDIFMMVHRRYQKKRKVRTYFLEREPASVRSK